MKTIKIASAVVLASMVASSAMAASGDYYGVVAAGYSVDSKAKVSGTVVNVDAKKGTKGFAGTVGVGYYVTDAIRSDVSFSFSPSNTYKKSGVKHTLTSYAGLVNAYYDFTGASIVPYVTVGAGAVSKVYKYTSSTTSLKSKRTTEFAYQAGLGLGYEVSSGVILDAGYRYTGSAGKMKVKGSDAKATVKGTHSFLAGARFSF